MHASKRWQASRPIGVFRYRPWGSSSKSGLQRNTRHTNQHIKHELRIYFCIFSCDSIFNYACLISRPAAPEGRLHAAAFARVTITAQKWACV